MSVIDSKSELSAESDFALILIGEVRRFRLAFVAKEYESTPWAIVQHGNVRLERVFDHKPTTQEIDGAFFGNDEGLCVLP